MALNSRLSWLAGMTIALLALLAVCFASTTQAATRLYSGSLIIQAFANDVTTGTAPPFQTLRIVGIPLIGRCNQEPYHAKETLTFPLPQGDFPTRTVTFTIPRYGGAIPTIDTNGDTVPDQVPDCGLATQAIGQPLYGTGPVNTTGATNTSRTANDPRQITLPAWALRRHMDGTASFERYGVYLWEVHYADLHNAGDGTGFFEQGVFKKNGGDGSFHLSHNEVCCPRTAIQKAGPNKFGGVMNLLGFYGDLEGYLYAGKDSVFNFDWLFDRIGGGGQVLDEGVVESGFITTLAHFGYTRTSGYETTSTVYQEVFKWTTGSVTVYAGGGTFPTVIRQKGFDNRTAGGSGVVQLVTPMLTKWDGAGQSSTGAIGIMTLSFAPEPSEWMLLASGVSMLGLMGWRRSRRP